MADVEWRPLTTLRPEPAVWTDVGELMLLMFTQDGVPTRAHRAETSIDAALAEPIRRRKSGSP